MDEDKQPTVANADTDWQTLLESAAIIALFILIAIVDGSAP